MSTQATVNAATLIAHQNAVVDGGPRWIYKEREGEKGIGDRLAEYPPAALQSAQISSPPEYCTILALLNISLKLDSAIYFKQNTPTHNRHAHAYNAT